MRKVLKTMVIAGWQTDKLHKKNIIDKQNQHQFCMSYRVQGCSISLRHIRSFFFFFFLLIIAATEPFMMFVIVLRKGPSILSILFRRHGA